MIVDTSALLAFFNWQEPDHGAVSHAIASSAEPLVISPFVIAELDELVSTRIGVDAELAVLAELAGGAWDLAPIDHGDLVRIHDVIDRYADQGIGAADASQVVPAARYRTRTIATLDRRHFEVLRPLDGGRFAIVP